MSLILTLFTDNAACTELIQVKCTHFSNFNGENTYYMFETEMIELSSCLIKNKILFKTDYSSVTITGKVRIRMDSK